MAVDIEAINARVREQSRFVELVKAESARAHAFIRGRGYVTPDDVKAIAFDLLRHRIIVTYEAEAVSWSSRRGRASARPRTEPRLPAGRRRAAG